MMSSASGNWGCRGEHQGHIILAGAGLSRDGAGLIRDGAGIIRDGSVYVYADRHVYLCDPYAVGAIIHGEAQGVHIYCAFHRLLYSYRP